MTSEKYKDWIICGRFIGQATGWDQADTFSMIIYNFKPCVELKEFFSLDSYLDVLIEFEQGTVVVDTCETKFDLIDLLQKCQRRSFP